MSDRKIDRLSHPNTDSHPESEPREHSGVIPQFFRFRERQTNKSPNPNSDDHICQRIKYRNTKTSRKN